MKEMDQIEQKELKEADVKKEETKASQVIPAHLEVFKQEMQRLGYSNDEIEKKLKEKMGKGAQRGGNIIGKLVASIRKAFKKQEHKEPTQEQIKAKVKEVEEMKVRGDTVYSQQKALERFQEQFGRVLTSEEIELIKQSSVQHDGREFVSKKEAENALKKLHQQQVAKQDEEKKEAKKNNTDTKAQEISFEAVRASIPGDGGAADIRLEDALRMIQREYGKYGVEKANDTLSNLVASKKTVKRGDGKYYVTEADLRAALAHRRTTPAEQEKPSSKEDDGVTFTSKEKAEQAWEEYARHRGRELSPTEKKLASMGVRPPDQLDKWFAKSKASDQKIAERSSAQEQPQEEEKIISLEHKQKEKKDQDTQQAQPLSHAASGGSGVLGELAQKLSQQEAALGRPLTDEEKRQWAAENLPKVAGGSGEAPRPSAQGGAADEPPLPEEQQPPVLRRPDGKIPAKMIDPQKAKELWIEVFAKNPTMSEEDKNRRLQAAEIGIPPNSDGSLPETISNFDEQRLEAILASNQPWAKLELQKINDERRKQGQLPIGIRISSHEIRNIADFIKGQDDMQKIDIAIRRLESFLRFAQKDITPEEYAKYQEAMDKAKASTNIWDKKDVLAELSKGLQRHYEEYEAKPEKNKPESFEELMEFIMRSEVSDYRPGGEFQLMDENGKAYPENFLAWVREKMYYFHDLNSNGEVNLGGEIFVPAYYSNIPLSTIINSNTYWRKRERTITGIVPEKYIDPDTKEEKVREKKVISHEDKDNDEYEKLRKHLMFEEWLFKLNHNTDAKYRLVSGQMPDLMKVIQGQYYNSDFTVDRSRLLWMLKLPGVRAGEVHNETLKKEKGELGNPGTVGKIIRSALLTYYYLPDEVMFKKVMGEKGVKAFYTSIINSSFTAEFDEIRKERRAASEKILDPDIINNQKDRESFINKVLASNRGIQREELEKIFTNDKSLEEFAKKAFFYQYERTTNKDWAQMHEEKDYNKLMEYNMMFNFYRSNKLKQPPIDMVRKAIRMGIAAQMKLDLTNKRDDLDMRYAEAWAYPMTSWTGIRAQNDTEAIGFDKWSNLLNTREYRIRQASGRGPFGITETIHGIERVGLNFWQGLRVQKEGQHDFETLLIHALQGGEGEDVNLDKLENFDFMTNAMRQFYIEQFSNGVKIFEALEGYGTNLVKSLKQDPKTGKLLIDFEHTNKVIKDGLWHDLRYLLDQPELPWGAMLRSSTKEEKEPRNRKLKFVTRKLEETLFADEVLNMGILPKEKKLGPDGKEIEHHGDKIAKDVFAWFIQKELEQRRAWGPGETRWGPTEIELMKSYFTEYWSENVEQVDHHGRIDFKTSKFFFSDKEWEEKIAEPVGAQLGGNPLKIKKDAHGHWKVYLSFGLWQKEGAVQIGTGVAGGLFAMFRKMFGYVLNGK